MTDRSIWSLFNAFLRLGLTSFGGPVAHLGYFRDEFVVRRRWLSDATFADIVSLCQFLPGPASSQVGITIGLMRGGYTGALVAWIGFTAPSALLMVLCAFGVSTFNGAIAGHAIHGLKVAAVAIVAQAVWGMARTLCPDAIRIWMMALSALACLAFPTALSQLVVLGIAAMIGVSLLKIHIVADDAEIPVAESHRVAVVMLAIFAALLLALPTISRVTGSQSIHIVDVFFRTGSLVFGGGHVVLPLLQSVVHTENWMSNDTFLAGYGAAQAVPGPLFTFAAYLGAARSVAPSGWFGGVLALGAIFAPSFLLVFGTIPFWGKLRRNMKARGALAGVNAAVVGLLLAAFCHPVWSSAILGPFDLIVAASAFVALMRFRVLPLLVVVACALATVFIGGLVN